MSQCVIHRRRVALDPLAAWLCVATRALMGFHVNDVTYVGPVLVLARYPAWALIPYLTLVHVLHCPASVLYSREQETGSLHRGTGADAERQPTKSGWDLISTVVYQTTRHFAAIAELCSPSAYSPCCIPIPRSDSELVNWRGCLCVVPRQTTPV